MIRFLKQAGVLLLMSAVPVFAGPLATAAASINAEIVTAAAALVGAIVIGFTLLGLSGGLGARMLTALVELAVIIVVIMNANSIGAWFRFSG